MKFRNLSLDKQPGSIPGYDGILDNWVTQYAVKAISSREAASLLEGKVNLDFHCWHVLSFITSPPVEIEHADEMEVDDEPVGNESLPLPAGEQPD